MAWRFESSPGHCGCEKGSGSPGPFFISGGQADDSISRSTTRSTASAARSFLLLSSDSLIFLAHTEMAPTAIWVAMVPRWVSAAYAAAWASVAPRLRADQLVTK